MAGSGSPCFARCTSPAIGIRLRVVAINELAAPDTIAYLTRFDTTHGRFGEVVCEGNEIRVNGDRIALCREPSTARVAMG